MLMSILVPLRLPRTNLCILEREKCRETLAADPYRLGTIGAVDCVPASTRWLTRAVAPHRADPSHQQIRKQILKSDRSTGRMKKSQSPCTRTGLFAEMAKRADP